MRRIAIRSIIAGGLVDIFLSSFLGAVSVVVVLLILSIAHTPPDSMQNVTGQIVHGNPWFIGAQVAIGGACSLLGGYLAARLARHDERLNGALSSIIGVGSGLVAIASGHDSQQLALQILILPLKPVLGFAGGSLRRRRIPIDRAGGPV